jgi:hypothetical protein
VNEIIPKSSAMLHELADLMESHSVRVVVEMTPAALNAELVALRDRLAEYENRLAHHEALREKRNEIRNANLMSRAKHLGLELLSIAEERGDFLADYQIADICRATGLSDRSIRRAKSDLIGAELIHEREKGVGAGNRKLIDLRIAKTITEIASLIDGTP